jgi:hypothetical protein
MSLHGFLLSPSRFSAPLVEVLVSAGFGKVCDFRRNLNAPSK